MRQFSSPCCLKTFLPSHASSRLTPSHSAGAELVDPGVVG